MHIMTDRLMYIVDDAVTGASRIDLARFLIGFMQDLAPLALFDLVPSGPLTGPDQSRFEALREYVQSAQGQRNDALVAGNLDLRDERAFSLLREIGPYLIDVELFRSRNVEGASEEDLLLWISDRSSSIFIALYPAEMERLVERFRVTFGKGPDAYFVLVPNKRRQRKNMRFWRK